MISSHSPQNILNNHSLELPQQEPQGFLGHRRVAILTYCQHVLLKIKEWIIDLFQRILHFFTQPQLPPRQPQPQLPLQSQPRSNSSTSSFDDEKKEAPPKILPPKTWTSTLQFADKKIGWAGEIIYISPPLNEVGLVCDNQKAATLILEQLGSESVVHGVVTQISHRCFRNEILLEDKITITEPKLSWSNYSSFLWAVNYDITIPFIDIEDDEDIVKTAEFSISCTGDIDEYKEILISGKPLTFKIEFRALS